MFVEQTAQGELAKNLRNRIKALQEVLGFGIKVVEKSWLHNQIKSKFLLNNLLEGSQCTQGGEESPA